MDGCIVYMTCGSVEEAKDITKKVVEERLELLGVLACLMHMSNAEFVVDVSGDDDGVESYHEEDEPMGTDVEESLSDGMEVDDEHRAALVEMVMYVHKSVEDVSVDYYDVLKRKNYVTPTSYLTLISTFMGMVRKRRKIVQDAKGR